MFFIFQLDSKRQSLHVPRMAVFRSEHDHYKNILSAMNDQRKHEHLCNVNIIGCSKELRAHRCVLMAASDYLSAVLARINFDNKNFSVDVSSANVDVHAVESVINYLYSGEIIINSDNLESIIKVASLFLITDIKEFCCKFLLDNLDWKTSMKYMRIALDHGFPIVIRDFAQIVKSRFQSSILSDDSFQNICPKELKFLVESCDIFSENCDLSQVFKFLLDWVRCGKSEEHEQVGCDIIRHLCTKMDVKAMDSFSEASTFEDMFENVGLFLDFKLTKGTNEDLFRDPHRHMTDTKSEEITSSKTPDAPIQDVQEKHVGDPYTPSEFPFQFDGSDNDGLVDSDPMMVETAMKTIELHQTSFDIDIEEIKCEESTTDQSKVEIEHIKESADKNMKFSCNECHKRFNKLQILNNHKKTHTNNIKLHKIDSNTVNDIKATDDNGNLVQMDTLANNDTNQIPLEQDTTSRDMGNVQPKEQTQMYSSTANTESFMSGSPRSKQRESYICHICFKTFQIREKLNLHVKLHTTVRPFDCEICKKRFKTKANLKQHMVTHSNDRPHKCELCQKSFKTKECLSSHMFVHGGIKRHVCKECNISFARASHLRSHVLKHSEAKLSCEICGKIYKQTSDFRKHVETHKYDTVFTCNTCGLKYESCQALRDHIKLHKIDSNTDSDMEIRDGVGNHVQTHTLASAYTDQIPLKQGVSSVDMDKVQLTEQKQIFSSPTTNSESLTPDSLRPSQRGNHTLSCHICFKTFQKKQNLNIHVKLHTTARPFDCVICRKRFKTKPKLKNHMVTHSNERPHQCKMCQKSFKSKECLSSHYMHVHSNIKRHVCKECNKSFAKPAELKLHMLKHESDERKHVCKICRKMFKHKCHLEAHEESHAKDSVYSCDTCGLQFEAQKAIEEHVKLHDSVADPLFQIKKEIEILSTVNTHMGTDTLDTVSVQQENNDALICETINVDNDPSDTIAQTLQDTMFKCGRCNKQFASRHLLRIHLKTHITSTPYDCVICKRKFKLKHYLKQHMTRHHSDVPDVFFRCSICQKQFRDKSYLTTHMLFHEGIKRHFCSICNKGFVVKGALSAHIKTHSNERPFHCKTCFKHFKDNASLKIHVLSHTDTALKSFMCEICGLEYKYEKSLGEHKKQKHTEIPPIFHCEICNKHFKRKYTLRRHEVTHTDNRPFICPTCGKQFRRDCNLNTHMLIHNDEKPFACDHCKSRFRDKSSFMRHQRIHTGEKSYCCKICMKYFTRAENLRGHNARFHT